MTPSTRRAEPSKAPLSEPLRPITLAPQSHAGGVEGGSLGRQVAHGCPKGAGALLWPWGGGGGEGRRGSRGQRGEGQMWPVLTQRNNDSSAAQSKEGGGGRALRAGAAATGGRRDRSRAKGEMGQGTSRQSTSNKGSRFKDKTKHIHRRAPTPAPLRGRTGGLGLGLEGVDGRATWRGPGGGRR